MSIFSAQAPAKAFIIGEYGAIAGNPALIATFQPEFELRVGVGSTDPFHPDSPAAKLLREFDAQDLAMEWRDPFHGQGGFGASTAQFITTGKVLEKLGRISRWDMKSAWETYRSFFADQKTSGADLIAQMSQGWNWVGRKGQNPFCEMAILPDLYLMLFSATHQPERKVATHQHLQSSEVAWVHDPQSAPFRNLSGKVDRARDALSAGRVSDFGAALTAYAEELNLLGLESTVAREDRRALSQVEGVLGVKGCGALLSDALIVLLDSSNIELLASTARAVNEEARKRDLKLVHERIPLGGNHAG